MGRPGTLSGFGTTDMAGNVKKWCWNEARDGKRFILGGGFDEPNYTSITQTHNRHGIAWRTSAFVASNSTPRPVLPHWPWSRQKVTFDAAYGSERVTAYLFLPIGASSPLQTVVYFPGAFALEDDKLDLAAVEDANEFLLKSGRALVVPIYKGMYERRDGLTAGGKPPAFFRDHVIAWAKDLGRSIDYLATRKDIDSKKVGYFGASMGAVQGALQPVLEKRIKAAILSSGGFQLTISYLPEVDPFNFAPHVTIPVLMLSGRYDNSFPLESSQNPLFHFLGTPDRDKKHVIYQGGHGAFPRPEAVRECLDFLDRYLGPVRR